MTDDTEGDDMPTHPRIVITGTVRAGAIGIGDGQTVSGVYIDDGSDDERPARPARESRAADGDSVRADSIEVTPGQPPTVRGQR